MGKLPNKNTRRVEHIMKMQLKAFRRKFGRDPMPSDPVFFDPNADTPQPFPQNALDAGMAEFASLLPPEFAYAYRKTGGLLLTEDNKDVMPAADRKAWEDAVDEYWRLNGEQEGGEPN